jgi:N-acylneuraminate cytidylyltransferase
MNIAIIPARGGSKRIPHKNIKEFFGKPMISYAIDAAKESGLFSHIIVSTDDSEIARIAKELGAETPFIRPANLADDHTPTAPVIKHAIEICEELGWKFEYACCIYPSVPLLKSLDLKLGRDLLINTSAEYCFPVAEFPSKIQRALKHDHAGLLSPFYPESELIRTQDLEDAYFDAGMFYWGSVKSWKAQEKIHCNGVGLTVPVWRVVDIDTPEDLHRAEIIYKIMLNDGTGNFHE